MYGPLLEYEQFTFIKGETQGLRVAACKNLKVLNFQLTLILTDPLCSPIEGLTN
jgi:hypothetical protein